MDSLKKVGKAVVLSTSLLLGSLSTSTTIPLLSNNIHYAEAASLVNYSKISYQTSANLKLRTGSSTKSKTILTIPKGKTVTSSQKLGSWYKVSYTYKSKGKNVTKTGWVSGDYLKKKASGITKSSVTKTNFLTTANVNLRSGASTKEKVILTIKKGSLVTAADKNGNWYKVTYSYTSNGKKISKTGWTSGDYLQKQSTADTKTVVTTTTPYTNTNFVTSENVNLRSGASIKEKIIVTIKKGTVVTANSKSGNWYKVTYSYTSKGKKMSKTGWISGGNLKEYNQYTNTPGTYYFTKKTTKLYSAPNTNKAMVSVPSNNGMYSTQKVVNSIGQTWYKVSYNGKSYYVYSVDVSKASVKSFTKLDYQVKTNTFVYSSYGTVFTKLVQLPKGTIISTTKSIGDWAAVTYKGKTGYVLLSNLQTVPEKEETIPIEKPSEQPVEPPVEQPAEQPKQPPTEKPAEDSQAAPSEEMAYLVTADLNLRKSGPGTTVLTTIPKGTTVISSAKLNDDWYQVTYNAQTGYVSSGYLKEYELTDYRFIDLRTESSVTAKQINDYIAANYKNTSNYKKIGADSVLLNKGQAFIDAGNRYGVNALYLAAHAIHESGFGTSNISLGKNNLFGYGAYDATPFVGAYRFSSVEACINYVAQKMKADYLNPYGKHFEGAMLGYRTNDKNGKRVENKSIGMNFWYASDPNWGNGIAKHMQKILAFNKKEYETPKIYSNYFSIPGIPDGGDQFPEGIQVIAKKDLSSEIKTGTIFTLLEKTNDYKVKVMFNDKQSTLSNISFSQYAKYISALNLGRVIDATTLNIRSTTDTTTSKNIIGKFNLHQFVSLALDENNKLIMDPSKKWYQVNVAGGKTGWVSASYIVKELQ
ncbi:SH3 domain-containing protein [Neobacillus mesonae]|uniref:SH3 domain-containing protein n=1 Tax=Neobacillus mesonae TaxID=1193713 RepID=UPI002E22E750|nr:SH3 domain-containing protein [Neobacillus mesonae]